MALSALKFFRKAVCWLLLILTVSGPSISWPSTALACGGPARYEIAIPMYGPNFLLSYIRNWRDYYEIFPKEQFQFLYPFKIMNMEADKLKLGIKFPTPASLEDFDLAVRRPDLKAAHKYAMAVVQEVLDMPAPAADDYQWALARALEFLEIEPLVKYTAPEIVSKVLTGGTLDITEVNSFPRPVLDALAVRGMDKEKVDEFLKEHPGNPRTPTLKFLALQKKFKREIPDGWPDEIRRWVAASKWREFESSADEWLKDYPNHPLYDLVKLWKNRVYYLEGKNNLAADNLLDIYPRHLPRVLYEMRFVRVPDERLDSVTDPVLLTALVPKTEKITPKQWTTWWKLSEKNVEEPWAVNLQERLLVKAYFLIKADKVPEGFPESPTNPTELWGKLRAVDLLAAGRLDAAREQIFSLKPDVEQAVLAATYYVKQNDLAAAAALDNLPRDVRHYMVRVLIDDKSLKPLESSGNKAIRGDVLFTEGVRLASSGHWAEGARLIEKTDPERAALWRKADALSKFKTGDGLLKYARYLKEKNGKLFYGIDVAWYGTLSEQYERNLAPKEKEYYDVDESGDAVREDKNPWKLPWSDKWENEAIERYFTGSSEIWQALQAYVKWLESAKPSPKMREIVKEADYCYNRLVNATGAYNHFWELYLGGKRQVFKSKSVFETSRSWETISPVNPIVVKLREAGKRAGVKYPKVKTPPPAPKTTFIETTIIPDSVKKEWKAVRLAIKDMNTGVRTEHVVNIGESMKVLDTDFKITILAFLPDFDHQYRRPNAMNIESTIITTRWEIPVNPAAQIVIEERGKEVEKGWRHFGSEPRLGVYENKRFKLFLLEGIRTTAPKPGR